MTWQIDLTSICLYSENLLKIVPLTCFMFLSSIGLKIVKCGFQSLNTKGALKS